MRKPGRRTGTPTAVSVRPRRGWRCATALALAGVALSLLTAPPAAADSSACTHHFSGPQICIRLDGEGGRNAVTGIWTNPPAHVASRSVILFRNGRFVDRALATRSGRALTHGWPTAHTGTEVELCVKFRGSRRMACQTTH
ncbi:hypothetical protein KQY30_32355 [Streptomyces sp. GMY02]|uniref:hypothetical protein n=1 Tax=Streptomyces sp. GMY02 TaxID=1333528 RepID=UPI001C2C9720|nr:hypothetical protein [Streptomyces sp. GMY02]QXE38230.1 hypothetical protein KQY30_32355 [Streptomyces sp. GMY02]